MELLSAIKFVRGAVSKKDLVPELKHFWIKDGAIRGYNGIIALHSPIDLQLACMPLAVPFIHAIAKCEDVLSFAMTATGRLRVQSGAFKAFIECTDIESTDLSPQGYLVDLDGDALLEAFKSVAPFIGRDPHRPWTNGVLLRGQSAFATNNVCVVEYWIGAELPLSANIPVEAVTEILRIGIAPMQAQVSDNTITFHYPDRRWLRTQLYVTDWPNLAPILDVPCNLLKVPDCLNEALEAVKPFVETHGKVYLRDGAVHTHSVEGLGASFEVAGFAAQGVYRLEMLDVVVKASKMADFTAYPKPCLFRSERLRGAIIGLSE